MLKQIQPTWYLTILDLPYSQLHYSIDYCIIHMDRKFSLAFRKWSHYIRTSLKGRPWSQRYKEVLVKFDILKNQSNKYIFITESLPEFLPRSINGLAGKLRPRNPRLPENRPVIQHFQTMQPYGKLKQNSFISTNCTLNLSSIIVTTHHLVEGKNFNHK